MSVCVSGCLCGCIFVFAPVCLCTFVCVCPCLSVSRRILLPLRRQPPARCPVPWSGGPGHSLRPRLRRAGTGQLSSCSCSSLCSPREKTNKQKGPTILVASILNIFQIICFEFFLHNPPIVAFQRPPQAARLRVMNVRFLRAAVPGADSEPRRLRPSSFHRRIILDGEEQTPTCCVVRAQTAPSVRHRSIARAVLSRAGSHRRHPHVPGKLSCGWQAPLNPGIMKQGLISNLSLIPAKGLVWKQGPTACES